MANRFIAGGVAYPGGKGKSYHRLINVMPPHDRYVESHLGAGAVMRRKRPARVNIGIEADDRVVARWRKMVIPGVDVVHGDALAVLPALALTADDLLYCDPPYLPSSRRRWDIYRHEVNEDGHEALLALLLSLPCMIVLSGYPSEMYARRLRDWTRMDYLAWTQAGPATEAMWTNYVPGDVLHDYSHIGEDFRQRERLRRRIDSLTSRLGAASPLERNAALAVLADVEPEAVIAAAARVR